MNLNRTELPKPTRHAAPVESQAPSLHLAHSAKPVVPRDKFIAVDGVCALVGFKKTTVYGWLKDERFGFPRPVRFGKCVRFSEAAVLQWIQNRMQAAAMESEGQA